MYLGQFLFVPEWATKPCSLFTWSLTFTNDQKKEHQGLKLYTSRLMLLENAAPVLEKEEKKQIELFDFMAECSQFHMSVEL